MAEVQQDNGGGKGKNHQKKMTIRVDFTPMVDMNMLLITFFMLCTTMIKSQTLNIALPSNEKVDNVENMSQASADDAITIIIDAKRKTGSMVPDTVNGKVINEVYYFDGKPLNGEDPSNPANLASNNNLQKAEFLTDEVNASGIPQARGIRKIIQDRNKEVLKKIEELKKAVGVKATIKDYGVDEKYFLDTLDAMVEQAFDDQCTGANPRYPLMSEIKEMYLKAYYGK